MSVDKFGRTYSGNSGKRGPPGEGFSLTDDGNYDIRNKVLRNLANPTKKDDAVNLNYLQSNSIVTKGNVWDAGGKAISNLARPGNDNDAVTRKYYFDFIPRSTLTYWIFYNKRLVQVNDPVDPTDGVNKRYLETYLKTKIDSLTTDVVKTAELESKLSPLTQNISELKTRQTNEKDELKRKLKSFSVHLFRHIHKSQGRAAESTPVDENNYLNWDEILKDVSLG